MVLPYYGTDFLKYVHTNHKKCQGGDHSGARPSCISHAKMRYKKILKMFAGPNDGDSASVSAAVSMGFEVSWRPVPRFVFSEVKSMPFNLQR